MVAQLQAAFLDNWMKTTGAGRSTAKTISRRWLPTGRLEAQVFKSGAQGGSESMELMYLLSLARRQAQRLHRKRLLRSRRADHPILDRARKRGVRVQIIVPGPNIDVKVVRRASRAPLGRPAQGRRGNLRIPAHDVPQRSC